MSSTFITMALLLLALSLTHITAVVAACLLLAADGIARAIRTLDRSGLARRRQAVDGRWRLGRRGAHCRSLLMIVSLPDSPIAISRAMPPDIDGGMTQIVRRIVAATYLFTFTWWEVVALAPLLAALWIAGVVALRRIKSGDLMWPVFFVLVVILSLFNLKTGSALLSERLAPYSWIAVVMTIASRQPGRRLRGCSAAATLPD